MEVDEDYIFEEEDFFFREIVKNTNNAVIVTDLAQKIVYTNRGFTEITGYSLDEVKGKHPSLLQGPETNTRTARRIGEKLKKFERVNETILNYTKDGSKYWINLDIYPFVDELGQPKHYMAIQSVVTEMKARETVVREQAQRIQENISYARTLQDALFRRSDHFKTLFRESFILDLPKDEVGGDFYLFDEYQNQTVILVGDCTGHGVSGAIMTAMCISVLTELLARYKTLSPAMVLNKANEKLAHMMRNGKSTVKDGMEATLVFVDPIKQTLRYASSRQEIYLCHDQQELTLKGLRKKNGLLQEYELLDDQLHYHRDSMLYLGTDGLKDQIGGKDTKRLTSKRLMQQLSGCFGKPASEQKQQLKHALSDWQQKNNEQTDDILLIGLRL